MTSKLNRNWVKFSKMKEKTFNNALCQHLSFEIFHIKNGLTNNYWKFYKRECLIRICCRTKIDALKNEKNWCINEYMNI